MMGGEANHSTEDIETKIAFLDAALSDLSDVVIGQQREIQMLKAQIEVLRDRLEEAQGPEQLLSPLQEKPPHY